MVGLGRFELPTSRLSGVRSNQLSYRPDFSPAEAFLLRYPGLEEMRRRRRAVVAAFRRVWRTAIYPQSLGETKASKPGIRHPDLVTEASSGTSLERR